MLGWAATQEQRSERPLFGDIQTASSQGLLGKGTSLQTYLFTVQLVGIVPQLHTTPGARVLISSSVFETFEKQCLAVTLLFYDPIFWGYSGWDITGPNTCSHDTSAHHVCYQIMSSFIIHLFYWGITQIHENIALIDFELLRTSFHKEKKREINGQYK